MRRLLFALCVGVAACADAASATPIRCQRDPELFARCVAASRRRSRRACAVQRRRRARLHRSGRRLELDVRRAVLAARSATLGDALIDASDDAHQRRRCQRSATPRRRQASVGSVARSRVRLPRLGRGRRLGEQVDRVAASSISRPTARSICIAAALRPFRRQRAEQRRRRAGDRDARIALAAVGIAEERRLACRARLRRRCAPPPAGSPAAVRAPAGHAGNVRPCCRSRRCFASRLRVSLRSPV